MKLVGIDYGLERTGLAATDPEGLLAYPLATLRLSSYPDRRTFLTALADRVMAEAPGLAVIGLPLLADGSESLTTRQVRNAARRLARRLACPCVFMNELLTSEAAAADLAEAGLSARRRKDVLDQQAAVRILESYLSAPGSAIPLDPPDSP